MLRGSRRWPATKAGPVGEAARRELHEEIGGTAAELRYVGQFYTSNGISHRVAYVCLTTCVELGKACSEPTELMEMRLVPVEEGVSMTREGKITDEPSALALLWCEPQQHPGPRRSQSLEVTE